MWSFTRSVVVGLARPVMVYLTSLSFTMILFFSGVIFFFENGANEKIDGSLNALYYTVTVMTSVGLGDISPVTPAGKIVSMVMMLAGTALFASFTAVLAASIMDIEMRNRDSGENR